MTTVVIDLEKQEVYTDSLASRENNGVITFTDVDKYSKVIYDEKSYLLVGSGSLDVFNRSVEQFCIDGSLTTKAKHSEIETLIAIIPIDNFEKISLYRSDKVPGWLLGLNSSYVWNRIEIPDNRFLCFGSGGNMASTLLNIGEMEDVRNVFEKVIKHDPYTGGEVIKVL